MNEVFKSIKKGLEEAIKYSKHNDAKKPRNNKERKYNNEKMGKVEIVKDFLPKPENLVFNEEHISNLSDAGGVKKRRTRKR